MLEHEEYLENMARALKQVFPTAEDLRAHCKMLSPQELQGIARWGSKRGQKFAKEEMKRRKIPTPFQKARKEIGFHIVLVIVSLTILIILLFSSCGPSRDANGNEWGRWHVWKRVTATRSESSSVIGQVECPPKNKIK